MTPECAILIGLPGAGKTTFYRQRLAATHVHVSKDLLPRSVKDKQARQARSIRAALDAGQSVAVDNTNVSVAERAAIIALGHAAGARVVGFYIEATTREAVARNELREGTGKVPKVAIFTRAKRLEPPRLSEGFDALQTFRVGPDGAFERVSSAALGASPE